MEILRRRDAVLALGSVMGLAPFSAAVAREQPAAVLSSGDGDERPVSGVRRDDFAREEDGKPSVVVESFERVVAIVVAEVDAGDPVSQEKAGRLSDDLQAMSLVSRLGPT